MGAPRGCARAGAPPGVEASRGARSRPSPSSARCCGSSPSSTTRSAHSPATGCSADRHVRRLAPRPRARPRVLARPEGLPSLILDLLERDGERAVLAAAIEESREAGRVVLVVGEAGIGKTALVADSCRDADGVLWGACDPLITPRPMGPLRDVADRLGDEFESAIEAGARERVLAAMLTALAGGAVLVIEDLHWADDATLDLVALLGRRLARAPGCVIMTSRAEPRIEVRRVLGALPREALRRIEPAALSAEAVAELAQRAGRDPADLHAVSGGNPFFVTEALAAPDGARRAGERARGGRAPPGADRRCRPRGRRAGRGQPGPGRAVAGGRGRGRDRRVHRRRAAEPARRDAGVPPRPRAARDRGRALAAAAPRARPARPGRAGGGR